MPETLNDLVDALAKFYPNLFKVDGDYKMIHLHGVWWDVYENGAYTAIFFEAVCREIAEKMGWRWKLKSAGISYLASIGAKQEVIEVHEKPYVAIGRALHRAFETQDESR